MSNRFLKFAQGKYAVNIPCSKPTTEMSPQEVDACLTAWFTSPEGWLGRKGATAFVVKVKATDKSHNKNSKVSRIQVPKAHCK